MLKAPLLTTAVQVDGHDYAPDEDGWVDPINPDHVAQLKAMGFREKHEVAADEAAAASALLAASADQPVTGEAIVGETLHLTDPAAAAAAAANGIGMVIVADYPHLASILIAEGVELEETVPHRELLETVDRVFGEVLARFAAFDPDGDNRPGGARKAADGADGPAPAPTGAEAEQDDEMLHGSSTLPSIVEAAGFSIQLGGVVVAAYSRWVEGLNEDTPTPVKAWNALPDAERDALLNALIADLTDAAAVEALIDPVTVVGRPAPADEEKIEDPADPAEVDSWAQAKCLTFLKQRQQTWKGNPAKAVAQQMVKDYLAAQQSQG